MDKKFISLWTLVLLLLVGLVTSGQAQLGAVGPINPDNGFPFFYQDAGLPGTVPGGARDPILLSLCLKNNGLCLLPGDVNTPTPGVAFPDNYGGTFPDEAFYWTGDAEVVTTGGGSGLLIMALEAAFANGPVVAGDQVVFGRIRFRIDNLVAGESYTITTPFGEFTQVADAVAVRSINFTEDIGLVQGDFTVVLNAKVGPFLTPTGFDPLNPTIQDAEGVFYIADAATPTTVTGSVTPVTADFGTANTPGFANFFRIVGPGVGTGSPDSCANNPAGPDDCVETNQFIISGQLAGNFGASPDRTTYTRNTADNGRVDVFASSIAGMNITASIPGRSIQLFEEPAGSGHYFGRFPFNTTTRPLPGNRIITLTNLTDTPITTVTNQLVDAVTVQQATFNTTGLVPGGTGTLTVRANSSDNSTTSPVTLTVFSADGTELGTLADNVAGDFTTFPTDRVTVTSSAGGTASQDVVVIGPNVRAP